MIKLKNKPTDCENCPFCYVWEGYERTNGKIEQKHLKRCGALMNNADFSSCPIEE